MKKTLPPKPHDHVAHKAALIRFFAAICLTISTILFAAGQAFGLNHRPRISPIPDQRIVTGDSFATMYFRIVDFDGGALNPPTRTVTGGFYPLSKIVVSPCGLMDACPADTNYFVSFTPVTNLTDGTATVTITVSDTLGASAATSFTT